MRRGRTFYLDRRNGKVMGVCAGIANQFGWDATLVRVGLVLLTLAGGFPWTAIAYGIVAWIGKPQPETRYGLDDPMPSRGSVREARDSMREIDRRMAEVETFVATSNASLAREIESLR
ncbi:MAG: PspC protein [Alphaproteobacteria bacterium]|nr:PspC protein [Alphaproteobacteria bacterium]MDB5722019.1 PspC protein [Alphaproteobacteria bacterium]